MKGGVYFDPEARLVGEHAAVVTARQARRKRFPEQVVEVVDSIDAAQRAADPARHRHAALVAGPSRSSEGVRLYYLVRWLDHGPA